MCSKLCRETGWSRWRLLVDRAQQGFFWTGFLGIAAATCTASASVLYVSADAPPGGNGASWASAYTFLQDGLAAAGPGSGVTEIHVAQGVYKPDRSAASPQGTGNRHATFQLLSNVALLGGYAGPLSADPDDRDWKMYETILSGDLLGNDGPNFTNYGDNSYTVVNASGADDAVLEGFTIMGGNANAGGSAVPQSWGGGLFLGAGSLTIHACEFWLNRARHGGAMFAGTLTHVTVTDSRFQWNRAFAGPGGAIRFGVGQGVPGASGEIRGCQFIGNHSDADGSALIAFHSCLDVSDSDFAGNGSGTGAAVTIGWPCAGTSFERNFIHGNTGFIGGGLVVAGANSVQIVDCIISDNFASGMGGGAIIAGPHSVINGLIVGNESHWGGGVGYDLGPEFINCTIAHNTGWGLESISASPSTPLLVQNSIVWGNSEGQLAPNSQAAVFSSNVEGGWTGVGSNNMNADPLFVQPGALNYRLSDASPCLDVGDNSAVPFWITTDLGGNPRFINGIVDLGAYEGPSGPLLPPAKLASFLQPGQNKFLSPLGGSILENPAIGFGNQSSDNADYIVVTQLDESPFPEASGFTVFMPTLHLETSLDDGEFRATVFMPFNAEDLKGKAPQDVRVTRLDEAAGEWVLAVEQNLSGPGGDPIIEFNDWFSTWTNVIGKHGVYWDPDQQTGLAWANLDYASYFSAGTEVVCTADLTGDGLVDIFDLLLLLSMWVSNDPAGDLNGDGQINVEDLIFILDNWGACPS